MRVEVVTLEKVNQYNNENKFYRVYYEIGGGQWGLIQYGSQRSGAVGGQFKECDSYDARDALRKKKSDGYTHVSTVIILLDDQKVQAFSGNKKVLGGYAEAEFAAGSRAQSTPTQKPSKITQTSARATPQTPKPTPQPPKPQDDVLNVASFGLDDITAKCIATLEVAATDPIKASTHVAVIRDEVEKAERELAKIHSYLTTIDLLTHEG